MNAFIIVALTLFIGLEASATEINCDFMQASLHIIAHRGASAYAPENTIKSFEMARSMQIKEVELDIQLTKDKKIILFHDKTLDEKTILKGHIRNYDLSELKKVDIGDWFDKNWNPPKKYKGTYLTSLENVFDHFGKTLFYHVEIKSEDQELPTLLWELIKERKLINRVMITSFHITQLKKMKSLSKDMLPISYLIQATARDDFIKQIHFAKHLDFNQVAINAKDFKREYVISASSLGLSIRGMGVKNKSDMNKLLTLGAQGMTINWPDWFLSRVRECRNFS